VRPGSSADEGVGTKRIRSALLAMRNHETGIPTGARPPTGSWIVSESKPSRTISFADPSMSAVVSISPLCKNTR
jgi:hypothetical protein